MALLVLLVVGATYRLTRLLVADAFPPIAAARTWIAGRWGPDSWQAYLSGCFWCASVYVSAAVTWTTDSLVRGGLAAPVLVAATASAVVGLVSFLDPE